MKTPTVNITSHQPLWITGEPCRQGSGISKSTRERLRSGSLHGSSGHCLEQLQSLYVILFFCLNNVLTKAPLLVHDALGSVVM